MFESLVGVGPQGLRTKLMFFSRNSMSGSPTSRGMNRLKNIVLAVLVGVGLAGLGACGASSAPSCADVGQSAVERTVGSERYERLPDRVKDSIDDNREQLANRTASTCEQRRWSARVRRCKHNASSHGEAAACEQLGGSR